MTRISVWQSRAHTAEHVSFPRLRLRIAIGMRMSSSFGGIVFKRSMDIALAGFLLAASLPLLAFAAIVIKLDSGGPVLFRQARMGRRSRRFQLLKLRTMRISSDGPVFTLGEDPRITRVGRWLRWRCGQRHSG